MLPATHFERAMRAVFSVYGIENKRGFRYNEFDKLGFMGVNALC